MSHFRLLNKASVERAATALFTDLNKSGYLAQLPASIEHDTMQTVRMPVYMLGFSLFDSHRISKSYTWFVPKPSVGAAELLRIYEKASVQPLYNTESVGEIVGKAFHRTSPERRMLAKFSTPDAWKSPILFLMAAALHIGGEPTERGVDLDGVLMAVEEDGVWSPRRGETVRLFPKAFDEETPITSFPTITTRNKVLTTLAALAYGHPAGPAVNVLTHALNESVLSEETLTQWGRLEGLAGEVLRANAAGKASDALNAVQSMLMDADHTFHLDDLFKVAVPDLISHRDLQAITGSPAKWSEGRVLGKRTAQAWIDRIAGVAYAKG